jgi:acyl-CoA reductase-like NAD-dependent aldehyde dehydrogenase
MTVEQTFCMLSQKDLIKARIATIEMGKAIKESRSEVTKCSWAIKYFADSGKNFLSEEVINTDARKSFVSFEPLGVVASLMPWNFPYWQALRFASPSLAGNTVILKPSSNTMQCGIEIENLFDKIGLPTGVFQTIIAASEEAEALIDSDGVNAVTFTGSIPVGAKVASDPGVPFGGIKNSGFGRELSKYGMHEFVNIKSVRFYDQLTIQHHVE